MSGNRRYILDTNAVISLLSGNSGIAEMLQNAEWVGISVITKLEFLCFEKLSANDKSQFVRFCNRVAIVDLVSSDVAQETAIIQFRKQYNLKLPDAIIAATAATADAALITADAHFDQVKEIAKISPH